MSANPTVTKLRFVSHITNVSVCHLLSQVGVDRCSKTALLIFSDVLQSLLLQLSRRISRSSNYLCSRSSHLTYVDGVQVLFSEFGYFQQNQRWLDLMNYLDKQISLSRQLFRSLSTVEPLDFFSLLTGLPFRIEIECKSAEATSCSPSTIGESDSFYYGWLPAIPAKVLPAEPAAKQLLRVKSEESFSPDGKVEWKTAAIVPCSDQLAALGSSVPAEVKKPPANEVEQPNTALFTWSGSSQIKPIDKVALVQRSVISVPLWMSADLNGGLLMPMIEPLSANLSKLQERTLLQTTQKK